MDVYTFATGASVDSGAVMHLTRSQVEARRHMLKPAEPITKGSEKGWHKAKDEADKRLPFVGNRSCYFKAGEEVGFDRLPSGSIEQAVTLGKGDKVVDGAIKIADLADPVAEAAKADLAKLHGTLATLADGLATAYAELKAAESARAELGDGADPAAVAAADKAVEAAEQVASDIDDAVVVFLAGFATPVGPVEKPEDAASTDGDEKPSEENPDGATTPNAGDKAPKSKKKAGAE